MLSPGQYSDGRKRVYIAGPYTRGDPCANTHAAIKAANILLDEGLAPFVPHLTHFWHTMSPRPWKDWMALDMAWLAAADAVLRLPGESRGADLEVGHAAERNIPVFFSVDGVLEWARRVDPC